MTRKRNAAEWEKLVEGWRRSGLGGREFAEQKRIRVEQLRWWKWHLGKSRPATSTSGAGTSPEMVRVEIRPPRPAEAAPSAIEIARDGWTIRVGRGADIGTLEQVLALVASRSTC